MDANSYTAACKNLAKTMDKVCDDHDANSPAPDESALYFEMRNSFENPLIRSREHRPRGVGWSCCYAIGYQFKVKY